MSRKNRITATETAFDILDAVNDAQGATAAELVEEVDLSRAGVYKHLRTLVAVDALINRDGIYVLGPKLTEYGLDTADSGFVPEQTEKIDQVAQSLDAPANLWINDDNTCHCVYTVLSEDRERYPRHRGEQELLTASPPGKAILAHLPRERRNELINTEGQPLLDQLEELRERKLLEEQLSDASEWVSIATPVLDPSDHPVAAIEIIIPSERAAGIDVKNNILGLLTETANKMRVEML
ncbi:IclR family transcriptional regulator [Natronoarchaeum mannanilyticum]|uniref:IclR family transcriptional regulator n=1 Tax=Natronoarchaeum mannanilyticum TaxID=926360 RepID=A0AAV3TFF5_9EURY